MDTAEPVRGHRATPRIIDCDIHHVPRDETELRDHLGKRWWHHFQRYGLRGMTGAHYPPSSPMYARRDAWPPSGAPPGGDYDFLREQLLDAFDLDYGVLNLLWEVGELADVAFAAELARALNDWQEERWLERDDRLRASLLMPYQDAELAVREIERHADDPRFVQALAVARTPEPLGRRRYWPIYAALEASAMPLAVHFGGAGGHPVTPAGFPYFYVEQHAGMVMAFQDQLTSLVCEGVFERFAGLRVVLVEGGCAWLPPLMWRLDRSWGRLREEVPHIKRAPSEQIRAHCWVTTQPIDEPPGRGGFQEIVEQLGMDDRIMFATDYPHWDFDSPDRALPPGLDPNMRAAVLGDNARALYGLTTRARPGGGPPEGTGT